MPQGIHAIFFSDAGGGMDGAGIARLADLERRGIVAAATSADSGPIGDMRTCSIVPRSFSRTTESAVDTTAVIIEM